MSLVTNVFRRGASYYFRTRVPARFRALLGRKELWRSLRTAHAREARQRASAAALLTEVLWRDFERLMSISSSVPSPAHVRALIDRWLKAELDQDAGLRRRFEVDREGDWYAGVVLEPDPEGPPHQVLERLNEEGLKALLEASDEEREARIGPPRTLLTNLTEAQLQRGLRHQVYEDSIDRHRKGDVSVAARHVRELFRAEALDLDETGDEFDTAVRLMTKAHRDLIQAINGRDVAMWRPNLDDDPAEDLLRRLSETSSALALHHLEPPTSSVSRRARLRFSDAAREALAAIAKAENFKSKRRDDYENAIRTFIDWRGADPLLGEVSSEVAGDYQVALGLYPTNVRKRPAYRDLSFFQERCARAEELNDTDLLGAETINGKYLTPLRRIYAWHEKAGSGLKNPFAGIAAPKSRRVDAHNKRRDFSTKELQRLFDLPLFTGSQGPKWGPLYHPGPVRVSDWRFWVPLICIFSGMRLNEACGLALADIKTDNGIAFFHCRDELEGQSAKAAASRRRVPMHPALLEIGLLDHVARLRREGAIRLFDDLKVDNDGYFSGRPSKFFLDLISRIEDEHADEPGNLVFHSTRHTATTRLRAAGVRMDVSEAIIGHESVGTHSAYGTFDIPTLKTAVDKIAYPGLDLSRLKLI